METSVFTQAAQLGGTVFTVVSFLWFLRHHLDDTNKRQTIRDKEQVKASNRQSSSNVNLAKSLQHLADKININSVVNTKNTKIIKENMVAVKDNTAAVKNGNGK